MKKYHVCHTPTDIKELVAKLNTKISIVFVADDCYPCERLKETISSYSPDFELNIVFVNTSQNPETAIEYEVMSAPCCIVLGKDGTSIGKMSGFSEVERLSEFYDKFFVQMSD